KCNSGGHVEKREGVQPSMRGETTSDRHFDHATLRQFFESLALEATGSVQRAGRECIRVRAVLHPGSRVWPHWLPCGADEYEFHADPEQGVLLTIIGRYRGEVFEVHEVTDVACDEPLDIGLFL